MGALVLGDLTLLHQLGLDVAQLELLVGQLTLGVANAEVNVTVAT